MFNKIGVGVITFLAFCYWLYVMRNDVSAKIRESRHWFLGWLSALIAIALMARGLDYLIWGSS